MQGDGGGGETQDLLQSAVSGLEKQASTAILSALGLLSSVVGALETQQASSLTRCSQRQVVQVSIPAPAAEMVPRSVIETMTAVCVRAFARRRALGVAALPVIPTSTAIAAH